MSASSAARESSAPAVFKFSSWYPQLLRGKTQSRRFANADARIDVTYGMPSSVIPPTVATSGDVDDWRHFTSNGVNKNVKNTAIMVCRTVTSLVRRVSMPPALEPAELKATTHEKLTWRRKQISQLGAETRGRCAAFGQCWQIIDRSQPHLKRLRRVNGFSASQHAEMSQTDDICHWRRNVVNDSDSWTLWSDEDGTLSSVSKVSTSSRGDE